MPRNKLDLRGKTMTELQALLVDADKAIATDNASQEMDAPLSVRLATNRIQILDRLKELKGM